MAANPNDRLFDPSAVRCFTSCFFFVLALTTPSLLNASAQEVIPGATTIRLDEIQANIQVLQEKLDEARTERDALRCALKAVCLRAFHDDGIPMWDRTNQQCQRGASAEG